LQYPGHYRQAADRGLRPGHRAGQPAAARLRRVRRGWQVRRPDARDPHAWPVLGWKLSFL